jgi:hypothetical protein
MGHQDPFAKFAAEDEHGLFLRGLIAFASDSVTLTLSIRLLYTNSPWNKRPVFRFWLLVLFVQFVPTIDKAPSSSVDPNESCATSRLA